MGFVVHFRLKPEADRQVVGQLVPAEQARVAALHQEGLLAAVYVAKDRQQGWLMFQTDDEAALRTALQSLPLHPYLAMEITPVNSPA